MGSHILIVMIAALAVTIVAERRNIQPPLLLATVGLAASFIPGLDRIELDPETILTLVLPPLLYSAAREFSLVSFMRRLGSIVNLGVFLVVVTAGAVAVATSALVPQLTLAAALVLGAVVAPPDAVTAVAVGRRLTGAHLLIPDFVPYLLYSALVGIAVGAVIGIVVHRVRLRLDNPSLSTVLGVLVPFTAYILAEELGASGVLAVVAAGLSLGDSARETDYSARIQEGNFWRTADSLLEAFVFAYIGLQLRFVIEDVLETGMPIHEFLGLALVLLVTVIAVRVGWVFLTGWLARRRAVALQKRLSDPRMEARLRDVSDKRRRCYELMPTFTWQESLVIGWAGMRGVVTLAAAAGIPLATGGGEAFPGRDLIQALAFAVAIGTLLLQGLTLPWLVRRLKISDPHEAERREQQHRVADQVGHEASVAAAKAFRDRQDDPQRKHMADLVLRRIETIGDWVDTDTSRGGSAAELGAELLAARREAVIRARDEDRLDDEVMREVLDALDAEQAAFAHRAPANGRAAR